MNLKTLKGQVEYVLSTNEASRNSDIALTLEIWRRFFPTLVHTHRASGDGAEREFVYTKDIFDLPREDNVKRIRAQFQNDMQKYLPTSLEVAEQRGINEETWRKHLGYPPKPVHHI